MLLVGWCANHPAAIPCAIVWSFDDMTFTPPSPLPESTMQKLVVIAALMRDQASLCQAVVTGELTLDRAHPAFWRLADQFTLAENALAEALDLHVESDAIDLAEFMRWRHDTLARLMPGWSDETAMAMSNCVLAFTNYSPLPGPEDEDNGMLDGEGLKLALYDELAVLEPWLAATAT